MQVVERHAVVLLIIYLPMQSKVYSVEIQKSFPHKAILEELSRPRQTSSSQRQHEKSNGHEAGGAQQRSSSTSTGRTADNLGSDGEGSATAAGEYTQEQVEAVKRYRKWRQS